MNNRNWRTTWGITWLMGNHSTKVRKLCTLRDQNDTLEITVAFWLNQSSNATKIDTNLRMALRMQMEQQIIIWFSIFGKFSTQRHGYHCQIMMATTKKVCAFNWTWCLMCTTNFQPWRSWKTSVKKMYLKVI